MLYFAVCYINERASLVQTVTLYCSTWVQF